MRFHFFVLFFSVTAIQFIDALPTYAGTVYGQSSSTVETALSPLTNRLRLPVQAPTRSPSDQPDQLLLVARQTARSIVSRSMEAGLAEAQQLEIAKFIVILAKALPPEVTTFMTLNPRGLVAWAARITDRELSKDFAKVDPTGFVLGVASEALVEFVREELPHSTLLQNIGIESLALAIRETTVAYAFRYGIRASIAAQCIVSGTTLWEALRADYEVNISAPRAQRKADAKNRIVTEFLKLRGDFKAQTSASLKMQRLAELDDFLANRGRPIFEGLSDQDTVRRRYVCSLARVAGLDWQTTLDCAPSGPGEKTQASPLTVSFNGLGPAAIGMTVAEASRALGVKLEEDDPASVDCHYAKSKSVRDVEFMISQGHIVRIEIRDRVIATTEGARIGMTESEINRIYANVQTEGNQYDDTAHDLWVYQDADHAANTQSEASSMNLYQKNPNVMLFETDGKTVWGYRVGRYQAVQLIEGCL